VAIFVSTQSGNWHDPATWGGAGVPDMGLDDAVIDTGHQVVVEAARTVSVFNGHSIAVAEGGTLRIQGELDIGISYLWIGGTVVAEGYDFCAWNASEVTVASGGVLQVDSSCYLRSGSTLTVEGELYVAYGASFDIYSGGQLTVEPGGTWELGGYCSLEYECQALIHDDFSVENGGYIGIYDVSVMNVEDSGAVFVLGTFATSWYSQIDVWGYFGVQYDGVLRVYWPSLINVYKDIHISGRMTGGGQILMLRREGRITDYNDNSLFVLDRAYGFGQTPVV